MKNFGYRINKKNQSYGFFLFEHPLYPCQFTVVEENERLIVRPIIAELTKKAYFYAFGTQNFTTEFREVKDNENVPKWVIIFMDNWSFKNPVKLNWDMPIADIQKFNEVLQGKQILLEHQLDIITEWLSNQ